MWTLIFSGNEHRDERTLCSEPAACYRLFPATAFPCQAAMGGCYDVDKIVARELYEYQKPECRGKIGPRQICREAGDYPVNQSEYVVFNHTDFSRLGFLRLELCVLMAVLFNPSDELLDIVARMIEVGLYEFMLKSR